MNQLKQVKQLDLDLIVWASACLRTIKRDKLNKSNQRARAHFLKEVARHYYEYKQNGKVYDS